MNEFNSILVGIDYSPFSVSALREASRIANWNNAKLTCLYVFEQEVIDEFHSQGTFDEPALLTKALLHLERFVADTVATGHNIHCKIDIGSPFKSVLTTANDTHADLLVLGSQGLDSKAVGRAGNLASRCARKAPIDVLLVRDRENEPFNNIVACLDFSENSIKAAHHAAAIAVQDNASLELLHIYRSPVYFAPEDPTFGPMFPPFDTKNIIDALTSKLDSLAHELNNQHPSLKIKTTVEERAVVAKGLNEILRERNADLAVLGTQGRTGLRGYFAGTTAEKIIHHSPCSTLMVKPADFHFQTK